MSWDLCLVIDAGGESPAIIEEYEDNITWNLQEMLSKATKLDGFRTLDGMIAKYAIPILDTAIKDMKAKPKIYKKLNPHNGWGTYEVALDSLEKLLCACVENPKATIRIQ